MFKLTLRGLATRKLRTILTSIAILLGVAMISGTFVLTDQINGAFADIFKTANAGTDVVLTKETAFTSDDGGSSSGPLPASLVQEVQGVDGVAKAEGAIFASGALVVDGKVKGSQGGAPSLVFTHTEEPFNTNEIVEGRFPERHGEVAVISQTADEADVSVGQHVGLTTRTGTAPVTIVGIFNFGSVSSLGGASVVSTTLADAQQWYDRKDEVSTILVSAEPGVTPTELKQRIEREVPSFVKVETGEENAKSQTDDVAGFIDGFLGPALLAFAAVAVLVGAFIIFNTFSITVAQRIREFAMVRTIGGSRRQVLTSVIFEALLVGLAASIAGIALGFGFARFMVWLFDAVGFGLPTTSASLAPRTVIVGLMVGTLVTLVASLVPAIRATRIPPIAALREGATLPAGRLAKVGPIIAALFLLGGIALLINGFVGSGSVSQRMLGMGGGAVLIFIGVAMLARFAVRPLANLVGIPLEKVFGPTARLARENAMRNPRRTAVTSAALMIGVGLVAFVSIFAAGIKDSFLGSIQRSVTGDLIIESVDSNSGGGLPPAVVRKGNDAPGVQSVSPILFQDVHITDKGSGFLNGVDPGTISDSYTFDWVQGDDASLAKLGASGALIEKNFAKDKGLNVGDSFGVLSATGERARFQVVGEYDDPVLFTGFIVSNQAAERLTPDPVASVVLVKLDQGVNQQAAADAVQSALGPTAKVRTNAEYRKNAEDQINQLVFLLYALLAISVIISLFGIVNTLVLTIYERTREIGMLRAIGTTRRQVRRMVRYESVITAVIGSVLGLIVGIFFGFVITKGLESEGVNFSLPVGQLIVFLIVAALAGVLAAILPARRASRLNVLDALAYE